MAKLFDAEGKEVEAFTADELEAKKKEALDVYIAANPDKSTEISVLQEKLRVAEEASKAGGGDDAQKKRLKDEKEAITKELNEKIDKIGKEFNDYKEGIVGGARTKLLASLSGGDKDLQAKIELKANNLTGYPQTPEGESQKLQDAYTLATGNKATPSMLDGVTGAGARGDGGGAPKATGETENSKAIGTALGVSPESSKKYGDAEIAQAQGKKV